MNNKKLTHPGIPSLKPKGRRLQNKTQPLSGILSPCQEKEAANKTTKKAFTLVELIITIIILAILGTIAFLSFQGYSRDARDSVRISDIGKIKTGFELFVIGNGKYPLPTNPTNITYSGGLVWIQGSYGDQTNTNVESINKLPLDPLTSSEYTYSVTPSRNEYQIAGVLEGGETALNINVNNQANALETKASALVTGNYNGEVVKSMSGETVCRVLGLPSIISTDSNTTDLEEIIENKKLVYSGYNNLPSSFSGTRFKQEGGFEYNPSSLLMYSDNVGCSDLGNSEIARVRLLKNIQENLKGTILGTNQDYQEVLDINVDEINPNNQSKIISRTLVGNILKVKLQSDSFIALSCDGGITNGYSYPNIAHGTIENVTKTTSIENGSIAYGAQALCNDGEISILNENTNITCNDGFVNNGLSCIEDLCGGIIPENAYSTATSQSVSKTWIHNITPGVCTFKCNENYTYNLGNNTCEADNQTTSCGGSLPDKSTQTTISTYNQTWNGTVWTPVYNWGESQSICDFNCNTNYTWNGEICEGNQETVTFDGNGGTGYTPTTKSVTYNTTLGSLPTNPTRTGYTFSGWYTAQTGGSQVTTGTLILGNVTVYAQWIQDGECGTAESVATTTAPTTNLCANGTSSSVTTNTANFTWTCSVIGATTDICSSIRQYTVTFNSNGGSTASPTSKAVDYNVVVGTLATTSRTNYTFNGWFTASTGGSQVTVSTLVLGDAIVYAQWTSNTQTATCGGTLPTHSTATNGTTYTQTWDGSSWTPAGVEYTKDAGTCGYTCTNGYTGTNCEIPPVFVSNCTANGQIYYADSSGNKLATVTNAGVATWESGKSISDLTCAGHIIVCSGSNTGYTLQACNLGATTLYTNQTFTSTTTERSTAVDAWAGYLYQWGRNKGFTGPVTQQSTQIVNASYNPSNDTYGFVWNSNLSSYRYDWIVNQDDNLWGNTPGTSIARQGPCASGYHVPAQTEWSGIVTAGGWGTNGTNLKNSLKMPMAGFRGRNNGTMLYQGSNGYYWSSSPNGTNGYFLFFFSSNINPSNLYNRTFGFSVRCIKN